MDERYVRQKAYQVERKYGESLNDIEERLHAQNYRCAICFTYIGGTETIGNKICTQAQIDHDHETGKVRGLLCRSCNIGLGQFKDQVRLLSRAIVYLEDNS